MKQEMRVLGIDDQGPESTPFPLRSRLPRIFELHGDEVGCAHAVAGRNSLKSLVQGYCRWPISDRLNLMLRGPVRGDLIGQDADAGAGL